MHKNAIYFVIKHMQILTICICFLLYDFIHFLSHPVFGYNIKTKISSKIQQIWLLNFFEIFIQKSLNFILKIFSNKLKKVFKIVCKKKFYGVCLGINCNKIELLKFINIHFEKRRFLYGTGDKKRWHKRGVQL